MGRGTIVSGGTDGLYTVDLDYGSTRADQLIDYLQTAITDIDVAIAAAESVAESASLSLSSVLSALNGAIVTYTGDESDENKEALQEATEAAAEAEVAKEKATVKVSGLKYQKMALESRLSAIQAIDVTERADVWCVDLTEDASGSVATIEVNGEGGQGILIAPEGRFPDAGDGYMTARAVQSAEQVFYNAAILPGWQKYAPTYRTGTISNIDYDNDTCTVTLDAASSSAQDLGINQAGLLEGVDIEYMNCNAKAFDNNDAVVVQFVGQSWANPKVIGFVSNPKPCGPYEIAFLVEMDQDNYIQSIDWGAPSAALDEYEFPDGEYTYPYGYIGHYLNTKTRALENGLPGAPGTVYAFYVSHLGLRIRFDIAFERQKAGSEFFTPELVSNIEESTYGTYYNLTCIADNETYVGGSGQNGFVVADDSGLSIATWNGAGGPYDVVVGPIVREYYHAAWLDAGNVLHQPDAGEYDARMRGLWSPPPNITAVIDDRELNYYLVQFGPLPEFSGYNFYYWHHHFNSETISQELVRTKWWVIYRLGNGGA